MTCYSYIVVGDDYGNFAQQPGVFTVSNLYERMIANEAWPELEACVVLGQGIGYHDREFILRTLAKRGIANVQTMPGIASLRDTHKSADENVLITETRKLGRGNYAFSLSITDKVDRLSDHVTGQHVGAMLLMEAARQATIAVLEHEYCRDSQEKFSLILERFDCHFSTYLFPLPTSLNTTIQELRTSSKNSAVVVTTTVRQGGSEIAVISLDVTLCPAKVLDKIESRKAQSAVKDLCRSLEQATVPAFEIA